MYSYEIKQMVTMRDICERYGFQINRSGFTNCPFHDEKTPSLKIYPNSRGWYCFGCGAGGDVINFVQQLFNIEYNDACRMLNNDFNLQLPFDRPLTLHEKSKIEKAKFDQKKTERKSKEVKKRYFLALDTYLKCEHEIKSNAPRTVQDEPNEAFLCAIRHYDGILFDLEECESEVINFDRQRNTKFVGG